MAGRNALCGRLLLWYWRHQLPYDRRLAARRAQRAPPNTDSGRKVPRCCSAPPATALRRLATDYAGALRENADASSLAFTALHARRLDLPFRTAAPLNRETAEALSARASEKLGRWFTAATAPAASRCGCLPAVARTGALWVKRCTSTQRRLPTRWIAVFPPVAKCSRRHCAKRCLTPIRRSWTIWPGAAGDCRV